MKAYVQYLDYSPVTGELYEPCGDRALVILDGRQNCQSWVQNAHACNGVRRPKYPHFKIMLGEFNRPIQVIYSTAQPHTMEPL